MALSLLSTVSISVRRLVPATMIAAAGVVAGSSIGEPGTACAAPKFDADFYHACIDQKQLLYEKGKITKQQRDAAFKECCDLAGGTSTFDKDADGYVCAAKADTPRTVPGDIPTQTLQPDTPPGLPTLTLEPG